MPRFEKLLVANRGEIARRVLRAAHDLGLRTVAVYSDADRDAPFVAEADEAVWIGPAEAHASYLDAGRLLGAAWRTGAQAIHPGYGFLAENAAFCEAVEAAGLVFVGPSADAIRRMGSKVEARKVAREAGVPVVPGFEERGATDADLLEAARAIGYPVLVKADLGGGGKGMRACRDEAALREAIAACRRESERAFGDGAIFLERLIEGARHIEVQVLGDGHGAVVHLGERECSIQRRHQKIIEEAPSPAVDAALRERLCGHAVELARAIGYVGAGTVEMLLAPDRSFYFLEMNTRLQVEHPVTELAYGVDLVALQLRVALDEPLPFAQAGVRARAHAIEARLYAEDPDQGFLPQTGRLVDWREPPGVRVDGGVCAHGEVSIHYDPMLAKVIAHGATRAEAARKLARGLGQLGVQGVGTNRDHLLRILGHEAFLAGATDTAFLERHEAALLADPDARALERRFAALAGLARVVAHRRAARLAEGAAPLPALCPGFRSSRFRDEVEVLEDASAGDAASTAALAPLELRYRHHALGHLAVALGDGEHEVRVRADDGIALRLAIDGVERTVRATLAGPWLYCQTPTETFRFRLCPRLRDPSRGGAAAQGGLQATMPGQVRRVLVAAGDLVEAGQTLLVLESMKMETALKAPCAGTVTRVRVREGEVVEAGEALCDLEAAPAAAPAPIAP